MARLVRENELSTTKIYSISDYSSSLTAKCVDYTYLGELSSNSTATSAYVYTGGSSSSKIATYNQFKAQALTASTFDIFVDVMLGNEAGGPCYFIILTERTNLNGKYFVPMCISGNSYSSYQTSYSYNYSGKVFKTGVVRCSNFIIGSIYSSPYGYFYNGVNTCQQMSYTTNGGTNYFSTIGTVSNTKFCTLSGTSKTAGLENELYHETRLNYTDLGSYNADNGICFGNNSTGDFSVYGLQSANIWGSMMFTWLNSGTYAHSGPGLYWKVPNGGNIYIKAAVESRTYSGTKVTLKGKLYMPINVFFTSYT